MFFFQVKGQNARKYKIQQVFVVKKGLNLKTLKLRRLVAINKPLFR